MDISQVESVILHGAQGRIDTFVLSDYFLFMNHQRYPLVFIKPLIDKFIPKYSNRINSTLKQISEITITPKQYNNMSLSAKQVVCAIYIGVRAQMSQHELYLSLMAIVGRFCEIHKDMVDDGVSMELQAMDNFFNSYAPKDLSPEDKRIIWDLAVSIGPLQRKNIINNNLIKKELIYNISDAVVMPTFGISWELFHNDMIRIERETMTLVDNERALGYIKHYFSNGWLGLIKDEPFGIFPKRLASQLINEK